MLADPPGYQVVSALRRAMVVGDFGGEARAAVTQVCAGVAGVRSVAFRANNR